MAKIQCNCPNPGPSCRIWVKCQRHEQVKLPQDIGTASRIQALDERLQDAEFGLIHAGNDVEDLRADVDSIRVDVDELKGGRP